MENGNVAAGLDNTGHDRVALKVLVVDDSVTIRRSAEIFLAQAGYQVLLAEDGLDALSQVAEYAPDLVFCDILMPRLDGYRTCALIKSSPQSRTVPVIMLSSKDSIFDRARGVAAGADEYLTKPFSKDSLLSAVTGYAPQVVKIQG